jgi:type IV pilus assembly protein PilA
MAYPPQGPPPSHAPAPPGYGYQGARRSGGGGGAIVGIIIVVVVGIFVVLPILAVLAIYGVRKYIANAKTAEARASVAQIGRLAAAAYERDGRLCASASDSVPQSVIRGGKYQSTSADWEVDRARNAGFACLGFTMTMPQYYRYSYDATGDSFTVTAKGDLNGDGVESSFQLDGRVQGGRVVLSPSIREMMPEE